MKKVFSLVLILATMLFTGCFSNGSKDESTDKKMTRAEGNYITVYYDNPTWFSSANNINIHYNAGNGWTAVPGIKMTKITDLYAQWSGWATTTISNASTLTFCFNNGTTWDNNSGKNYTISSPGVYIVKNGVVTKQGITIDLYVAGNLITPATDLGGLPVTLYKDNAVYATGTITYTTKSGVYATFKNVLPGNYKIVINTEIDSTYEGRILLKGENAFTITNTMTYYAGNITFTKIAANQGFMSVNFSVADSNVRKTPLIGQNVKVYKDGVYFKDLKIEQYSYFTNEIYAGIHDLKSGTYKVVLDTTVNNIKYTGEGSIKVNGADPSEQTASLVITATDLNKNGVIGVNFQVPGDSITIRKEANLIGKTVKIYKDGVFLKDLRIGQYSYFTNEAYAYSAGLATGTYKAVLDTTVNNIRYTGEASVYVNGADSTEKSINITVIETALNTITVYYDNPTWFASANNINIHYNAGSGWTTAPGVAMTKITDYYGSWGGWAKMTVNTSSLTFCFNNGSTWDNNSGKNYSITSAGVYTVKNGVITSVK